MKNLVVLSLICLLFCSAASAASEQSDPQPLEAKDALNFEQPAEATAIPEPGTGLILAVGGYLAIRRKRRPEQ